MLSAYKRYPQVEAQTLSCTIFRNSLYFMRTQLFQLRLSPEQSGKVEYEREIHSFISDSQQPFALVFDFSALLGGQP
jgi:hypothetical protein